MFLSLLNFAENSVFNDILMALEVLMTFLGCLYIAHCIKSDFFLSLQSILNLKFYLAFLPFIPEMFIEHLSCTRYFSRHWGYSDKQSREKYLSV